MFQGEIVLIGMFINRLQSVKRFKVTYLFIFSNLLKYVKRFAAWLK